MLQSSLNSSCDQDVCKIFFAELFTCSEILTDLVSEPKPNQNSKICMCSFWGMLRGLRVFIGNFSRYQETK